MKRKVLFGSIALAALILIGASACQSTGGNDGRLITVLSPAMTTPLAERVPLTPRLDTLDGKKIYLYNTQWGGTEANKSVFEEMQAWFAKNHPTTTVEIYAGPGWMTYDSGFLKVINDNKVDGVVIGISG